MSLSELLPPSFAAPELLADDQAAIDEKDDRLPPATLTVTLTVKSASS